MRLLILGGTREARTLAQALHDNLPSLDVITSLAGATEGATEEQPDIRGAVRVGGFGGSEGLATYLKDTAIDAVIDATHPFAERITAHAVQACAQTGTAYLRLDRPQWHMPADTDVVFVPDAVEAARLVARTSKSALLTIGRKELDAFDGLEKVHLVVRVIDLPEPSQRLANAHYITGRPPFSVAGEVALMREHQIDTVVTKASGGDATRAKLDAAAQIGARLVVLRRPPPPDGPRVSSVDDALAWIQSRGDAA